MYFADEIRPHQGLAPSGVRVAKAELDLAGELIDRYTSTFDIGKYEDTYRDALLAVIKAKQKGNDIHVDTAEDGGDEAPPDLLEALRESVARHTHSGKSSSRSSERTRGDGKSAGKNGKTARVAARTKSELVREAKRRRVKGYSGMSKEELVTALT